MRKLYADIMDSTILQQRIIDKLNNAIPRETN
jgi:hypothetical protein